MLNRASTLKNLLDCMNNFLRMLYNKDYPFYAQIMQAIFSRDIPQVTGIFHLELKVATNAWNELYDDVYLALYKNWKPTTQLMLVHGELLELAVFSNFQM